MSMLEDTPPKARSPFSEASEMFRRNHAAVIGLITLLFIIGVAIIGPMVYPGDPFDMVWIPFTPPGEEGYLLGTDYLGRDILSLLIHGAKVSLTVGVSAAVRYISITSASSIEPPAGKIGQPLAFATASSRSDASNRP